MDRGEGDADREVAREEGEGGVEEGTEGEGEAENDGLVGGGWGVRSGEYVGDGESENGVEKHASERNGSAKFTGRSARLTRTQAIRF